jgi:quinol monooxygenase YgiN
MLETTNLSPGRREGTLLAKILWGLAMVLVLLLAQPEASLAAQPVDIAGEPIRVVGRLPLQLNPSEREDFERRTLALAKTTRAKDPVTSYSCNADIEHSGTYVFDEIWPSEQALQDHLQTSHFKDWWAWVEPHLSGDLVINAAPTAAFHAIS